MCSRKTTRGAKAVCLCMIQPFIISVFQNLGSGCFFRPPTFFSESGGKFCRIEVRHFFPPKRGSRYNSRLLINSTPDMKKLFNQMCGFINPKSTLGFLSPNHLSEGKPLSKHLRPGSQSTRSPSIRQASTDIGVPLARLKDNSCLS